MKKFIVVIAALVILVSSAWGQEVVREEYYSYQEIGEEAFSNLIDVLQEDAFGHHYTYYYIEAPYKDDPEYIGWASYIIVSYYENGGIRYMFAHDQTQEIIWATDTYGWKIHGQDFIATRGKSDINRQIRVEQIKAIAKLPQSIKDAYEDGYYFYVKEIK
jgi:hypothetical protein